MEERFSYQNHDVRVETVQPLFADGWLWRISVDDQIQARPAWKICKGPEQALSLGISEAKLILDAAGQIAKATRSP
ncbi:hypothetical protein PMI40_00838 [Herbaspirillum sp. YR522]|nr:hypothetical protein PMI40_00838 [Herbaspirillum sp. YR522]